MISRDVALLELVVERADIDAPRVVLSSDGVDGVGGIDYDIDYDIESTCAHTAHAIILD